MLAQRSRGSDLPKGLDAAWDSLLGLANRSLPRVRRFLARAAGIVALETGVKDLTDARLREEALSIRDTFRRGRQTDKQVDHAYAVVREVAARQIGLKPFPVQVAGALAIHDGCVAEMATGEGKTLTATLPATVAGWCGRGCHVVTVNDYLAKRDCEWMTRIYEFCGLTAAYIEQKTDLAARRRAYGADITYCTNKEVTADFLRDRLALGKLRGLPSALLAKIADGSGSGTDRVVQRGLHFAIIDEADSILIDEAVTPLIISGDAPNEEQVEAFQQAVALADQLRTPGDYRVNERYREVDLTSSGKNRLAQLSGNYGGIWLGRRRREELVVQALTARHFYSLDKQYVVDDGKIVIVDEFTGRLMPDRTWRDGLHQAIEAKERLTVNPPKDTYARVSFQRFFRLYRKLSGMTGTAAEAWREFWQIYHMPTVVIPTNRPCVRRHKADRVFATEDAKWRAVVDEIVTLHRQGRPALVGTRSVRFSEHLSLLLTAKGLEHQVLNAVRHAEEAQIVAAAGQPGKITVATNMAGRGTDIKLGRGVAEAGGLAVLATERHEAGRIDRQLYGRAGRQGDPGSAQAIVCLEDELVRRHAPHLTRMLAGRHGKSAREISTATTRHLFDAAQRKAERMALRQRKGVLRTDDWLDEYLGFAGSEK
ncbi:MAG: preprotein translocase subunit SecA [Planctomycetes bacterium ADurb.Bin126]|nr:MAG: preprotein translocase subunit SecA [Planctomycetes bacterium ADurb.Bin126]